jgi:hypothetical protein
MQMIGLRKDSDDTANGERFTLTMEDPVDRKPAYATDSFPNLTEDAVREMLRTIEDSDAYAERLLQHARADFLARQQQST